MSTRVNGANRAILTLLGLLLLLAAAAGLIISFGVRAIGGLTLPRPDRPVLPGGALRAANNSPWFWWVVAAACVLIALLALRWLAAQLATDRIRQLDLTTNDRDGMTTLDAGAVGEAAADEAKTIRGVDDASAHLRTRPGQELVLGLDVAEYADLNTVRNQLEQTVVAHTRQAIDEPDLPITIELRPTNNRRAVA